MLGIKISHFLITGKLGAGGMGEVYRAEDLNLNREVAIKVLPEAFAADKERLARFQREAKVLASLNHPNIASIYGLEEADGKRLLAMELVEGETLDEKIVRGPIPQDETFEFLRQVAEGLEAAHEKGIIHRDLKPSNVKVTPEGKAKILDFGLAKPQVEELAAADIAHSPTITAQMTQPGMILGTAAYMSPEQAKGRAVDKRADIWGFGCILFECLTGNKAFPGETITESLAAVLRGEPDWSALPADLPPVIRNLLRRCLERDTVERLRDIGEARIALRRTAAAGRTGAFAGTGTEFAPIIGAAAIPQPLISLDPRRLSFLWPVAIGATALLAGLLIGSFLLKSERPPAPSPPVASVINLEPGWALAGFRYGAQDLQRPSRSALAISHDGRCLVYCAARADFKSEDGRQLFVRQAGQLEAKPIPGTERAVGPFFSPDDQWVGFWSDGSLKKIRLAGGLAQDVCSFFDPFGADWGADNVILLGSENRGIFRVPAEGGIPEQLTQPDPKREEVGHRFPSFLPGGKTVLITVVGDAFDVRPRVAFLDLGTRQWRYLLEDAADARYVSSGHLIFLRQGMLLAVPFDRVKGVLTGQPVPVISNIMQSLNMLSNIHNSAAGQFSISASGWLAYVAGGSQPDWRASLVWVDEKGRETPITRELGPYSCPRLSPDGKRVALTTTGLEWSIKVYDLDREILSPLTLEGKANGANWTPDGKRLIFGWYKWGNPNLYWQPADGSAVKERLTDDDAINVGGTWSPDGKRFAYVRFSKNVDIYVLDVRNRTSSPLLASEAIETYPEFSPDGDWLAYCSTESGKQEVYVRSLTGGGRSQISADGGREPLWDRTGERVYYRSMNGSMLWAVDVQMHPVFAAGKPRLVFDRPYQTTSGVRDYDISLDGRRFLMVKSSEYSPKLATEAVLIQNWFEELKRLAPIRK